MAAMDQAIPIPNLSPIVISSVPGQRGMTSPSSQLIPLSFFLSFPSEASPFAASSAARVDAKRAPSKKRDIRKRASAAIVARYCLYDGRSLPQAHSSHSHLRSLTMAQTLLQSMSCLGGGLAMLLHPPWPGGSPH